MDEESVDEKRKIMNNFSYFFLFVAFIFMYLYAKSIQLFEESYVDVKLRINTLPTLHKGKNAYIDFTAIGINKKFEIRSSSLKYTKISSLTNDIKYGDTIKVKMLYSEYFDIERESLINNFNEIYGFVFKNEEMIEYKNAIRARINADLLIVYFCLWNIFCIQIYKRIDFKPRLELIESITLGCSIIYFLFLYYRPDL